MRTSKDTRRISTLSMCLLLSLAFHIGTAAVLVLTVQAPFNKRQADKSSTQHVYHLTLSTPEKQASHTPPPEKETEQKPFAKTDPDRPQQPPDHADFEGQRDTRAEGMDNTTRSSDAPLPTMEGEEKEEINTLHQERQDGDVDFNGKKEIQALPQPEATEQNQPLPPAPPPPPGSPDSTPTAEQTTTEPTDRENTPETTKTHSPDAPVEDGTLDVSPPQEEPAEQESPPPPSPGTPETHGTTAATPVPVAQVRAPVYDPSLADHAQPPGLRTTERRSRSTGQFVIGRMPACNVEATPRGQYEEMIYRRIAAQWYFACDQHRGDIIPGTIIIAIRITERGTVESMNLVNRRGAGVSQQSFTFAAIRRAQIPPMPKEVHKTLIGNLLEIIITFDFN